MFDPDLAETISFLLEPIPKWVTGYDGLSYDYAVGDMVDLRSFPAEHLPESLPIQPWITRRPAALLPLAYPLDIDYDELGWEGANNQLGYCLFAADEAPVYDWLIRIGKIEESDVPELKSAVAAIQTLSLLPEE